jgi:outer membrane protein TolC
MQSVNNAYLQKLIDTAKVYYPKYKTFNHRINIALEDVKKAKLSWFDLITFSLTYSPNNSTTIMTPTLTGYQVGMFFNVGNLIVKPHTIKQAKEEVAIATLNKQEYDLNIEAEVKSRYYKYIQYLAALKIENESIIDIEAILKQAKYRFEKGEETLENYSKAIIAFNAQKQNIVSAEGYVLIAKSSLEEIIGKKLEDIH